MGIAPYKTFTFDGESSADYGVYITGTGVFNAPERSVEMIEIAGRNGSFALDRGKFENIEVTYRVGIVDDSEADFADRISDFRNWLCSKVGYCRLEDEYNPNEYRMAVYASGMELEHDLLIAGEAEITFNCKPQRWLTSGETAVAVADGGTLDNPTLFESEPLLAVKGYGNINFNGYDIDIENVVIGNITIIENGSFSSSPAEYDINPDFLNIGDSISLSFTIKTELKCVASNGQTAIYKNNSEQPADSQSGFTTTRTQGVFTTQGGGQFINGTNGSITNTASGSVTASYQLIPGQSQQATHIITYSITQSIQYDATTNKITITITASGSTTQPGRTISFINSGVNNILLTANSTISALGNPTYIDCDIGECYMIKNGEIITLNGVIDLGADLPKLISGTNTINYDNTITSLEVTPRWWKV